MSSPYGPPGPQQPLPPPPHGPYTQQGPGYGPGPGQPYAPPPGYGHPMPIPPAEPKNGLGLAALICALLAAPCAFVPILFVIGGPLALVALCLGIAAQARVRRGRATNGRMTAIATLLAAFGLIAAIHSAYTVLTAARDLVNDQVPTSEQIVDCVNRATTPDEIAACAG